MSAKSWSGVSDQGLYTALACAVVIVGAVFAFMNPYSATGRTLKTAEVYHIGLHLADDSQVIFIVCAREQPVEHPRDHHRSERQDVGQRR